MNVNEKLANIMCFLSIMFGEDDDVRAKIMEFPPDYIIEKFERYVTSTRIEYHWGMHPTLRRQVWKPYMDKWEIELEEFKDD